MREMLGLGDILRRKVLRLIINPIRVSWRWEERQERRRMHMQEERSPRLRRKVVNVDVNWHMVWRVRLSDQTREIKDGFSYRQVRPRTVR